MNISTTTSFRYTYTATKNAITKKQETSDVNIYEKQTKKEYKNVVKEFKKRHPESAEHVNEQVRAGKNYIKNCGADNISRSDMTMEEYKEFFKQLMDKIPFDSSHMNDTEIWSITEEGWEQMKNDPDYEAWVLGYTVENRSVHFPFQSSNLCIEKFGASIEEHLGQSFPKDTENTNKSDKNEESWWQKRHRKTKELLKEQEIKARKRAAANKKVLNEQWEKEYIESRNRMELYYTERLSNMQNINITPKKINHKAVSDRIEAYELTAGFDVMNNISGEA